MSDSKTATERLRELLDERGVDWDAPNSCLRNEFTLFSASGDFGMQCFEAYERTDNVLELTVTFYDELTPEQAIAATLGERTCEVVASEPDGQMWVYRHEFSCDCGQRNLFTTSNEPPKHCPNCGARIVDKSELMGGAE